MKIGKYEFKIKKTTPAPEKNVSFKQFNGGATKWVNPQNYDYSKPEVNRYASNDYLPFGTDNLYPQLLLDMYVGSPFHNAIIEFKTVSCLGDGIEVTVNDKPGLETDILKKRIEQKFNRRFLKRIIKEYLIHNRLYFKAKMNSIDIEIVPSDYVRLSAKENNAVYINNDWLLRRNDYERYDTYKSGSDKKIFIIDYNEVTPGMVGYAVPQYASASNWIWLDSQIAFFQKQNIENSVNPSAIVKFYNEINDPEEKKQFIDEFQKSFTGAKNAGKVFVLFSDGKELSPDIIMADPNKLDEAFADTQTNIINNVSYAHLINPVLMGISTEGKLGQTNEINDAYQLYNINFLSSLQDDIEYYLNDTLSKLNINATIKIKRKEVKFENTVTNANTDNKNNNYKK